VSWLNRNACRSTLQRRSQATPLLCSCCWRWWPASRYGLIRPATAWARDCAFGKRTYNARTETVADKPSYRIAWAKKQFCLVPMERFFEPCWQTGKAVRWSIHHIDRAPFAVAAIWDSWTDKSPGEIVRSFSMLTINADNHSVMGRFHKPGDEKRSLVVVPTDRWSDWLGASATAARDLLFAMNTVELEATALDKSTISPSEALQETWTI
jgi:putative SOS response-associated peptidase YedK